MPVSDKTPEQAMHELVEAMSKLIPHIAHIAHIKKAFFDSYVAEGFTEAQALELTKNITTF